MWIRPDGAGYCYLVAEEGDKARIDFVSSATSRMKGQVLTSDTALFRAAATWKPVDGRIDRISYANPGLYRIGSASSRHASADGTTRHRGQHRL